MSEEYGCDLSTGLARVIHQGVLGHVLGATFPCIGARTALHRGAYRFGFYPILGSHQATVLLSKDLSRYSSDRTRIRSDVDAFVAAFEGPGALTEPLFEDLLWRQLQNLHDLDTAPWDEAVSSDPGDPAWEFSFAGTAYFIVGLHEASSRLSRRFEWPVIAFVAHAQFVRLRASERLERFRKITRRRDIDLQGHLNPNLSDFGERSSAGQYAGRHVEPDWVCPFETVRAPGVATHRIASEP